MNWVKWASEILGAFVTVLFIGIFFRACWEILSFGWNLFDLIF